MRLLCAPSCFLALSLALTACGRGQDDKDRYEATGGQAVAPKNADAVAAQTCSEHEVAIVGTVDGLSINARVTSIAGSLQDATEAAPGIVVFTFSDGAGELTLDLEAAATVGTEVLSIASLRLENAASIALGNCDVRSSRLTIASRERVKGTFKLAKLRRLESGTCVGPELSGELSGCFSN